MLVLRFRSAEVWRQCCDLAHMRRLYRQQGARRISHRLQQLEAMATTDDLSFLPFDSYELDDGSMEIVVDENLALIVEPDMTETEGSAPMQTLIVTEVRVHSRVRRSS